MQSGKTNCENTSLHNNFAADLQSGPFVGTASTHLLNLSTTTKMYLNPLTQSIMSMWSIIRWRNGPLGSGICAIGAENAFLTLWCAQTSHSAKVLSTVFAKNGAHQTV